MYEHLALLRPNIAFNAKPVHKKKNVLVNLKDFC